MAGPKQSPGPSPFLLATVLARVVIFLLIWLGVFLAMFLGYFTVPVLLLGGLAIIYTIIDLSLYMAVSRQNRTRELRQSFLRTIAQKEEQSHDE